MAKCVARLHEALLAGLAGPILGAFAHLSARDVPTAAHWPSTAAIARGGRVQIQQVLINRLRNAHGGEIWCENDASGGAVFGFSLPAFERSMAWTS